MENAKIENFQMRVFGSFSNTVYYQNLVIGVILRNVVAILGPKKKLCGLEITVLSFFRSHLLLSFSLLCVMVVYSSRSISLYCLFLRTNVVWPISWEAVNPLFSLLFCGQKWATAVLPFFRNQDHIWDNCAKIEWERKIDITKCWIIIWALWCCKNIHLIVSVFMDPTFKQANNILKGGLDRCIPQSFLPHQII